MWTSNNRVTRIGRFDNLLDILAKVMRRATHHTCQQELVGVVAINLVYKAAVAVCGSLCKIAATAIHSRVFRLTQTSTYGGDDDACNAGEVDDDDEAKSSECCFHG